LCIDDAPDILEVLDLAIRIKWPECTVLRAEGGPQGLDVFDSEEPDLVIVDLGMPGMDGYEVIRRLRRKSDVPIIILSVRDEETDKAKGFELGADDYIVKPFGHLDLHGRMNAVLRRSASHSSN